MVSLSWLGILEWIIEFWWDSRDACDPRADPSAQVSYQWGKAGIYCDSVLEACETSR